MPAPYALKHHAILHSTSTRASSKSLLTIRWKKPSLGHKFWFCHYLTGTSAFPFLGLSFVTCEMHHSSFLLFYLSTEETQQSLTLETLTQYQGCTPGD